MICVSDLSFQVGQFRLQRVSFEIQTGEYGVLMGKTGCGKTTLLEVICGLKPLAGGRVLLGGQDVTRHKPAERHIGYVPQDGALFTTISVHGHLAFALQIRRTPRKEIERRVGELAELLGIGHLLNRSTRGLSGGERQRVAIGRALSFRPTTLLLDEPLTALDDATREQMYVLLAQVRQRTGVTALHITHSVHEAARLGDRQLCLEGGQVLERPLSRNERIPLADDQGNICGESRSHEAIPAASVRGRHSR